MTKKTVTDQLEARIAANVRGDSVDPEMAAQLLVEYLGKERPSYRKLAARHGIAACTVMRAIKRAAAEADS